MSIIKPLIIEGTNKTPQVIFDPDNSFFEISGRSLPENVIKTYEPVLTWVEQNMGNIHQSVQFNIKIDYLNSASAKMMSLLFTRLEEFYKSGIDIQVNWFYNPEDEDIHSEGEIFSMIKKVPIKLVAIEDLPEDDE